MNRRNAIAIAAALVLVSGACLARSATRIVPSGKVVSESRDAKGFTGIALSVPGTVVVRQGEPTSVAIEADDNLMPEIETVVERGSLRVRFRRSLDLSGRQTIRLLVTTPEIESLAVAGSGDIVAEALRTRSLDISVAGSGDVRIARLEAQKLKASVAGSGDIKVAGQADEVTASIAGSGDIEARKLRSKRSRVKIAGSGDISLWVLETLEASTAGSGDIHYYGDPSVTRKVAGSGSVKRLGAAP